MSGPVRPPLTMETIDGSVEGRPINTIKVTNGDLSISGTVATIDTGGGVPVNADFLLSFDGSVPASLTNARKLVVGNNISMAHGAGANDDMVISATPGGSDGQIQFNTSGVLVGTSVLSTNKTSSLSVTASSGDPFFVLNSTTKAITLKCDENQKLKIEGGTNEWVLDASSGTGGITFPDGTTQTTAATSSTNSFDVQWNGAPIGSTSQYDVYQPLAQGPYGSTRYEIGQPSQYYMFNQFQAFRPWIAPRTGTIAGFSLSLTSPASAGSQTLGVGIYSDDGEGMPDTRIAFTTFDVQGGSARAIRNTSFTGTPSVTRGTQYWFGYTCTNNDAFTVTSIGGQFNNNPNIVPIQSVPTAVPTDYTGQLVFFDTSGQTTPIAGPIARTDLTPETASFSSITDAGRRWPNIYIDY